MKIVRKTIRTRIKGLDGLRLLHISDLHLRGEKKKIERHIKKLSLLSFDLLFITGDVIDSNKGIRPLCRYLKMLKPRYGAWFVLGNHDEFSLDLRHLFAFHRFKGRVKNNNLDLLFKSLKNINIKVLLNQSEEIKINNSSIRITGIKIPFGIDRTRPNTPFYKEKLKEIEMLFSKQNESQFSIVLTHLPDMVDIIKNIKADLYLAGHTHGGQIRLPIMGPIFAFSKLQKKYNKGLFKLKDGYLNVSAGMGQSRETPVRFMCPPEATLITLKHQKDSS